MQNQNSDSATAGLLAGIGAFLIWGLAPLYFNLLDGISAPEILSHRSVWSFILAVLLLALLGKFKDFRDTLGSRKKMTTLLLSTLLIGSNWLVFIWAITNQHMLDASLGYYINPLVSISLGVLFMGERLRPLQWLAVALAAAGIGYELWQFGRVPLIALFLAFSFGFYGLVRKRAPVDSLTGLAVETLYMLPVAIIFLLWTDSPSSNLLTNSWQLNGLLLLAGPITLTPLLLFNIAARRLNLSTVGFLQYIGPTLMLLLATFFYGEPLSESKLITFAIVWFALFLYSSDALVHRRKRRQLRKTSL